MIVWGVGAAQALSTRAAAASAENGAMTESGFERSIFLSYGAWVKSNAFSNEVIDLGEVAGGAGGRGAGGHGAGEAKDR